MTATKIILTEDCTRPIFESGGATADAGGEVGIQSSAFSIPGGTLTVHLVDARQST
jgi:hypothetical protein